MKIPAGCTAICAPPRRDGLRLAIAVDWLILAVAMFANLLQWVTRQPAPGYDRAFVAAVHVNRPVPRNPRAEKIILICWGLIAIKHVAVIWAVHHYAVPFHQLWINFPTFLLGLVATWAYYARD